MKVLSIKQHTYLQTLTHYTDLADRRAQSNEYEVFIMSFAKSLEVVDEFNKLK